MDYMEDKEYVRLQTRDFLSPKDYSRHLIFCMDMYKEFVKD